MNEGDGIAIGNGHAFVGLYGVGGFKAIDLSDHAHMEIDCAYEPIAGVGGIAYDDSILFVTDRQSRDLIALDITDASNPVLLDEVYTGDYARGVDVSLQWVYVATSSSDLKIYDKSDPSNLQLAGALDLPGSGWAQDVLVDGSFAYIARETDGLSQVNISRLPAVTLTSNFVTGAFFVDVAACGDYLYGLSTDTLYLFHRTTFSLLDKHVIEGGGAKACIPARLYDPAFADTVDFIYVTCWGSKGKPLNIYFIEPFVVEPPTGTESTPVAAARISVSNYPNPFNPSTTIRYYSPKAHVDVTLEVFDMAGRSVYTATAKADREGFNELRWNGTSKSGSPVASGVYAYSVKIEGDTAKGKMILLK
jgi:hypothetical protein